MYEHGAAVLVPYVADLLPRPLHRHAEGPTEGPVLLAPNHFSFLDHFFVAAFLRRKVQLHGEVAAVQAADAVDLHPRRGVPGAARPPATPRRSRPRTPSWAAATWSDVHRGRPLAQRRRSGEPKPGVGRLALETGVPVVPTAIVGTAKVRNWKRLQFPKVTVQFGDPIRFEQVENPTREQAQAASPRSSSPRSRSSTTGSSRTAASGRSVPPGLPGGRRRRPAAGRWPADATTDTRSVTGQVTRSWRPMRRASL